MESFFSELLHNWSHLGLFGVLLAAGMGLPFPEDIPLILAGLIVRRTDGSLLMMILTGLAGVMVGDSILFLMGRRYGPGIVERRWFRRIAKPWLLEKARKKYEDHGAKILFVGRFMPGLRAVLFLTAGVFKVPYWKFLVFDGSAALISVPLWIWAGWHFSGEIEKRGSRPSCERNLTRSTSSPRPNPCARPVGMIETVPLFAFPTWFNGIGWVSPSEPRRRR